MSISDKIGIEQTAAALRAAKAAHKPGYQTSEFFAVVAGAAIIALNNKLGLGLTSEQIGSLAVAVAGYALSRGMAKRSR